MAISVETAFLIFGGILFIGYFGEIVSKRFSVPSALLLLLIGFMLKLGGYVDSDSITSIQALFSALALIVLLFDGGLTLHLQTVLFKSGRVLAMAIICTILALMVSYLLFTALGLNPFVGAILGAIAGGIGSAITISMLNSLNLSEKIKNFLTLESSITDVFSIILAIVLTDALISGNIELQTIGQGIAARFSVGLIIGAIAGFISITTLSKIQKGYSYMLTFAIVLILYAITEFLAGSGAIAVLVFGILFGNEALIRNLLKIDNSKEELLVREFQEEVSFFIRTFFFVFLGAVVNIGNIYNFLIALALCILLYAVRYISVFISTANSEFFEFRKVLTVIGPRGLATAVLATYPLVALQNALKTTPTPYLQSILPHVAILPEISFYVIIITILFTTIGVPLVVNNKEKPKEKPKKKTDGAT